MNLIIDIGNTRVKLAVYEENSCLDKFIFLKKYFFKNTKKILTEYPKVKKGIISSVDFFSKEEEGELKKLLKLTVVSPEMILPFKNLYQTPNTLGLDRIALIAAAADQYQKENVLVIDAGTCNL